MMKYLKTILILIAIPLLTAATVHKFYVSTTKVEYQENKKSLQIISKIFVDDIETVLRERYNNASLSFGTKNETKKEEEYLKKYALQKFKIKIDGKEVPLTYIGREYDIDVVKVYMEVSNQIAFKTIEIENKMLFDLSPQQQNIIHIKNEGVRKSLVLDKDTPSGVLNFD